MCPSFPSLSGNTASESTLRYIARVIRRSSGRVSSFLELAERKADGGLPPISYRFDAPDQLPQ